MTRSSFSRLSLCVLLAIVLSACSKPSPTDSPSEATTPSAIEKVESEPKPISPGGIDLTERPPKQLSEWNFFKNPTAQLPNEGVTPYFVNNEHFADYASVKRLFWLPEGKKITYTAEGVLQFPLGSIILQTFSFPDTNKPGGESLIETRLLMNGGGEDGWAPMVYRWDDEMLDAKSAVGGKLIEVSNIHVDATTQTTNYLIPNLNECSRCHENNDGMANPIGLTARNLSLQIDGKNQLLTWVEAGLLIEAPAQAEEFPASIVWNDPSKGSVEERARAWLDANCAHCHNPNGPGSISGLDLSFTQNNPVSIGMYKPPVAAGRGSEGFRFSIDPGSPDTSFIINRLRSTDPAVMMPPLGRMTADEEAVALISEWIAQINFTEEEAQKLISEQKELLNKILQGDAPLTEDN